MFTDLINFVQIFKVLRVVCNSSTDFLRYLPLTFASLAGPRLLGGEEGLDYCLYEISATQTECRSDLDLRVFPQMLSTKNFPCCSILSGTHRAAKLLAHALARLLAGRTSTPSANLSNATESIIVS